MNLHDLLGPEYTDPAGRDTHNWEVRTYAGSEPFAIRWYDRPGGGDPVVQVVGTERGLDGWKWEVYVGGQSRIADQAPTLKEALYEMDRASDGIT